MSNDIDRIVAVTITRQSTTATMESFNGLLIAAEFLITAPANNHFSSSERVRSYGSLSELSTDGWDETSLVYLAAQAVFAQDPSIDTIYIGRKLTGDDGTETWTTALATMLTASSDWYGLVVSTRSLEDQKLVADWVESNDKLCILASSDSVNVSSIYNSTPTCIADYLKANSYDRTAVIYHPDADGTSNDPCPDAAWFGLCFSSDPGSITWAFKTLTGVEAYTLTSSKFAYASGKNCNVYTSIADVSCTQFGLVGSGEYLDVIHGLDWLQAYIQNKVFTTLVNTDKVPFTSAGVQVVVGQLKAALEEGVNVGLLADYDVDYPDVADVSSANKSARTLPDITFAGTLAGAIHKTEINGVVTL